ncbi:type VI secretion system tube protein TssD [uncultured Olleya sp.]|uniref:type VI secretion system tube protein TssD n=1 Tax=uncultured Olleya sp. TaxID=757243 RepID=UPI002591FA6A|nr:type VI secretion system tube protein TssD [uncultured Olleya sp.]
MSITAKLYVEDKVFNILNFNFSFNQQSSMSGLPSAKPTGGQFDIVLEATKDPIFYEWMTSNSLMNKVKIEISQSFTFGKTRKIELIDVYCLLHQDTFNGVNNQPMQTLIKLSPAILLQNGEKMFEWYWKVTD